MSEQQNRLDEFQQEVDELGVSGGTVNPERTASTVGIVLLITGGFFALIWSFTKRGDPGVEANANTQLVEVIHANNNIWIALFGIALILLGAAIWIRNSLTRYLRYWLIRMIYEERANTDRLIEAMRERQ